MLFLSEQLKEALESYNRKFRIKYIKLEVRHSGLFDCHAIHSPKFFLELSYSYLIKIVAGGKSMENKNASRVYGYVRVSSADQNEERQLVAMAQHNNFIQKGKSHLQ